MAQPENSTDPGEDLNVANLMETKSERSPDSDEVGKSSDPIFTIEPDRFIQSPYSCVEPDVRNPARSIIRAEACLFAAFGDQLPPAGIPLIKILAEMEAAILSACAKLKAGYPDQETLKRASDRWYELMIAFALWNANATQLALDDRAPVWLWLPGTNELKLPELFDSAARQVIHDIEARLANEGIMLVISNPNFVCIEPGRSAFSPRIYKARESYSPQAHETVTQCYREIQGKCRYTDLRVCLGLKTLYRPDRHACIPCEASVLKTLYARLQKDLDKTAGGSMRYYAATSFEPSKSDEELFCAASPRSILDDHIPAERAVDGILYIETLSELDDLHRLFRVKPPTTDR